MATKEHRTTAGCNFEIADVTPELDKALDGAWEADSMAEIYFTIDGRQILTMELLEVYHSIDGIGRVRSGAMCTRHITTPATHAVMVNVPTRSSANCYKAYIFVCDHCKTAIAAVSTKFRDPMASNSHKYFTPPMFSGGQGAPVTNKLFELDQGNTRGRMQRYLFGDRDYHITVLDDEMTATQEALGRFKYGFEEADKVHTDEYIRMWAFMKLGWTPESLTDEAESIRERAYSALGWNLAVTDKSPTLRLRGYQTSGWTQKAFKDEEAQIRLEAYRALGWKKSALEDVNPTIRREAYRHFGFTKAALLDMNVDIRREAYCAFQFTPSAQNDMDQTIRENYQIWQSI